MFEISCKNMAYGEFKSLLGLVLICPKDRCQIFGVRLRLMSSNFSPKIIFQSRLLRLQPFSFRLREIGIYMDMVNGNHLNRLYLIYERRLLKNCKYVPKPLA